MRGSEGGIPYNTPNRPLTVHLRAKGSSKPACGANPWHFQTTMDPTHVTCWDCKRKAGGTPPRTVGCPGACDDTTHGHDVPERGHFIKEQT